MWAQPTKNYKTGFPLGRFAPWDLGVLAAISCPEGYRPGLVGWLVQPCPLLVQRDICWVGATAPLTCLASFAGSSFHRFRAGCYAGRRRWRAARTACESTNVYTQAQMRASRRAHTAELESDPLLECKCASVDGLRESSGRDFRPREAPSHYPTPTWSQVRAYFKLRGHDCNSRACIMCTDGDNVRALQV